MTVFLVHHADAVGPEVDAQRPLSSRGLAQAASLALRAKEAGVAPVLIWHSGKLRARQTAEAFWRTCAPFARFEAVRGLQPGDWTGIAVDALAAETRDVLIVGHMPHIPALARALAPASDGVPQHGMVALERAGERYVERWRLEPDEP